MANRDHDRNDEIVGLLNIIGKRLIDSEQERDSLKKILESQQDTLSGLQEKSEESEKIYLDLKGRLARREEAEEKITKKQRDFEDTFDEWQSEYSQKIEKALTVAEHIEEVMAQQNRLFRRIDQMTQDRARVTRKLERIEDTVLETKDALEARAMVLLTDTQTAEDSEKPHMAAAAPDKTADKKAFKKSLRPIDEQDSRNDHTESMLWRYPRHVRTAIMTVLLGTAFLGGLAINESGLVFWPVREQNSPAALQQMAGMTEDSPSIKTDATSGQNSGQDDAPIQLTEKAISDRPAEEPESRNKDTASEGTVTARKQATKDTDEQAGKDDPQDVFYKDEQEMKMAMAENPDRLAEKLNEIEPVATHTATPDAPETVAAKTKKPDTAKTENPVRPASLTPAAKTKTSEFDNTASFIENAYDHRPLSEKAKPDSDLPEIVREIEKRAFEGIPEAQHDLAAIYTAGHGGVKINYEKAVFWFTEAAYNGIGNARYNLGVLYHQGLGVKQDTHKAISWYKAAADVGHPEAQYNLGIAYIEGIGTAYDPQKAASYFEQAALSGIPEAAYNLGIVHENGLTESSRPEEALYWYKKAADAGSTEARNALSQLAKKLGIDPQKVEDILSDLETLTETPADDNNEAALRQETGKNTKTASTQSSEALRTAEIETTNTLTMQDLLGPDGKPIEKAVRHYQSKNKEVPEKSPQDQTAPQQELAMTDSGETPDASDAQINASQAITAQIQEQLVYLGLYPGPADGVVTPLTKDAIRTYQSLYGLGVTGAPSESLLAHILMGTEEGGYGDANIAEQGSFRNRQTDVGSRAE